MKRQVGGRVWIEKRKFGPRRAQWGTILNDAQSDLPCWFCDDDECRDWPDVKLDDGGMAFHVCECEMHDGPDWRMRA